MEEEAEIAAPGNWTNSDAGENKAEKVHVPTIEGLTAVIIDTKTTTENHLPPGLLPNLVPNLDLGRDLDLAIATTPKEDRQRN